MKQITIMEFEPGDVIRNTTIDDIRYQVTMMVIKTAHRKDGTCAYKCLTEHGKVTSELNLLNIEYLYHIDLSRFLKDVED